MITTDNQVKIMKRNLSKGKSPGISAASSGMDEKTARTYWDLGRLPSELKASIEKWWSNVSSV